MAVRERAVPVGRRERQKAENRAAILKAAIDVFSEKGYGATGVRDIIRRTDLAAGTFYNYFPDKESVFRALIEDGTARMRARVHEIRAGAQTIEEFVDHAFRAFFEFAIEDPALFELWQRNTTEVRKLVFMPEMRAGITDLFKDISQAVDAGLLPPIDADYMASAMAGVAVEVARRMSRREPVDVEGATRFISDLFTGGIERMGRRIEAEAAGGGQAAGGDAA